MVLSDQTTHLIILSILNVNSKLSHFMYRGGLIFGLGLHPRHLLHAV